MIYSVRLLPATRISSMGGAYRLGCLPCLVKSYHTAFRPCQYAPAMPRKSKLGVYLWLPASPGTSCKTGRSSMCFIWIWRMRLSGEAKSEFGVFWSECGPSLSTSQGMPTYAWHAQGLTLAFTLASLYLVPFRLGRAGAIQGNVGPRTPTAWDGGSRRDNPVPPARLFMCCIHFPLPFLYPARSFQIRPWPVLCATSGS